MQLSVPAFLTAWMALAAPAQAQSLPPPQNVVSLTASATVEVTKDLLQLTFSISREGTDANVVQN